MFHFIPYPEPRTATMIRKDRVQSRKEASLTGKVFSFYLGGLAVVTALLLISLCK